ncbi:MAG: IS1182 family transposase [Chloroflexota bacterium]|nr:IS1182 family transposase [Chloroflexota bacterium]
MPLREMSRDQAWLLPPTLDELVPPDHPARFVAEFVDALNRDDWTELGVQPDGEPLGAPAYHPRALLSVWLYGFMTGVRSCRKLEAAYRDQIPYLWLTGWQYPDHNTLWRFYKKHRQSMRRLFRRTVRTAVAMELVVLAVPAVDGTKVIANAALIQTYDAKRLQELIERVESAIESLEAQNEGGEDGVVARLPEKLAEQKELRRRVRQAMNDLPGMERPNRYKRPARINLTDKDARLMRTRQGIVRSYNAQAMVSPVATDEGVTGMLVTASDVVDEPNDTAQLTQMVEQAEEMTGAKVPLTLADAGYFAGRHVAELHRRGQQVVMPDMARPTDHPYHKHQFAYDDDTDSYICPHGQNLRFSGMKIDKTKKARTYRVASGTICQGCPAFGVCTKNGRYGRTIEIGQNDTALRRHRDWMKTEEAKQAYLRRLPLIEPLFAILRNQLGARQFALRGLPNVKAEWSMFATAYNLRTLWRVWRTRLDTRVNAI